MRENDAGGLHGIRVECVIPILRAADLQKSLRFYVDVLGFSPD
jgi:Glyoxalase/Bleomycin resistance protein/Dioxygenase superfamily